MTERKFTDEEVIKALEKALTDVDAPIGEHWGCGFLTTQNIKDTLDLINRKNAEIERLETEKVKLHKLIPKMIKEAKTEAIKEYAERLEETNKQIEAEWVVSGDECDRRAECSHCGKEYAVQKGMLQLQKFPYCPKCGAKMKGGEG